MQQEMVSLERRITSLEDDEIEVMERAEEAQRTLDSLTAQLTDTDAEIAELTAARDARLAEIDQALGELDGQRGPIVADLPADLLALYDRLRESKGGVGAALLRAAALRGLQPRPRPRRGRHDPGRGRRRGDPVRRVQPDPGPHLRESGL